MQMFICLSVRICVFWAVFFFMLFVCVIPFWLLASLICRVFLWHSFVPVFFFPCSSFSLIFVCFLFYSALFCFIPTLELTLWANDYFVLSVFWQDLA